MSGRYARLAVTEQARQPGTSLFSSRIDLTGDPDRRDQPKLRLYRPRLVVEIPVKEGMRPTSRTQDVQEHDDGHVLVRSMKVVAGEKRPLCIMQAPRPPTDHDHFVERAIDDGGTPSIGPVRRF